MKATAINTNLDDLHPDDRAARVWISNNLLAARVRQGLLNRDVAARVGRTDGWAHKFFATLNWRLETAQTMARALGYRLTFTVVWPDGQLTAHVAARSEAWEAAWSRFTRSPNPERREEAERVDLCDFARRVREAQGLGATALGHRLNMSGFSVKAWESGERPGYLLVTAQRFFRALGGQLVPVLGSDEIPDGLIVGPMTFASPDPATGGRVMIVENSDRTLVWNTDEPATVVSFPAATWNAWIQEAGDE